jgi:cyclopropane fatty-acyl-phospholipid synthase-like methyltransferase
MSESIQPLRQNPFYFCRAILKGDHLHFGLWSDDDSKMSMEEAQENMFNLLLSFFPPPPAEVLDVGCGLGFSAHLLSRRGYRVTAIAPSSEMIEYAQHTYGEAGVEFKELGFFDEDKDVFARERYDVLLFQESAQYLSPLDAVMEKSRLLLKDNGFLIIGDKVCYDRSVKSETAVHLVNNFITAFAENGFRITENKKIGKNVFKTHDFIIEAFTKNRDKIMTECAEKETAGLDFYINGWNRQKNWNLQGKTGYEIFVARKDSFSIKPYSAGDETKILSAFNEVFGVQRNIEHWYWKFRDNPYGSFKISEVFSKDRNLVTHYAGYPMPFYCDVNDAPNIFLSLQIGDTLTRPEVRHIGRGKTSILSRTAQHFYAKFCEGVLFAYGFNTGTIKKLGERFLGYQYIDPIPYRVKKIKAIPLSCRSLLEKLFPMYSVRMIHAFNDSFDHLFEKAASTYKLLVRRDARYLTWRYRDCPDKDYIMVSVCSKFGKLVGWSVFLKKDDCLLWGDALFLREYQDAVKYLLNYVLSIPRYKGIKRIEGWFSENPVWWNEILDQLGFENTNEPDNLFPGFYILTDNDMLTKLRNYFYYTMGDSDLF